MGLSKYHYISASEAAAARNPQGACRGSCNKVSKYAVPIYSQNPYLQTPTGRKYIGSGSRPVNPKGPSKFCCCKPH